MKNILQSFTTYHTHLLLFEKILIRIILLSLIFLSFGQVIGRNFFSVGFMWLDELFRIGLLWLAFIGAALATEYHRHIKIEVLTRLIRSEKTKKIVDISVLVFTSLICIFLFVASVQFLMNESKYAMSLLFHGIPDWIFRLIIPYAFFAMAIRYVVYIGKIIYDIDLEIEEDEQFESKLKGVL